MYQYIFFDLDGTLTDPGKGITDSVAYALEKFGIRNEDRRELYRFIGPPLLDSFMDFYGFSEADSLRAIEYYREYFRDTGIFENEVYKGIPEMLKTLKEFGRTVVLATSKPDEFARRILDHFDLAKYFDFVAGATMDGSRSRKADVIRFAMEELKITDPSKILMVGDREHDVLGAKENQIRCAGVTFGYGSREELEKAGASYIAEAPEEIITIV